MRDIRIGFIGAGQMAEATARGILESRIVAAGNILASDLSLDRRKLFDSLGMHSTQDNLAVVKQSDVVIIAVKPQNVADLLLEIGPLLRKDQLLISICAGMPTTVFEKASAVPLRVVRVMPNLPMRVRMGASALCTGRHATRDDMLLAGEIFGAAGKAVEVEERHMDAVTALSGSGPAYFYFLVEVMIEAGIREGMPTETAKALAVQTARGAAEMMAVEQDVPPEEFRRRVTSKGGTTQAAFDVIERMNVREGLLQAVLAAAQRGRELGKR